MQRNEYIRRALGAESTDESQNPSSAEPQSNTSVPNEELEPPALAPGEILFVTVLVLIVAIAVGAAIISILQRRRTAREEKEEACPSVDDTQDAAASTAALGSDLPRDAIDVLFPDQSKHGGLSYADDALIGTSSRRPSVDSPPGEERGYRRKPSADSLRSGDVRYLRNESTTSLSSRVSYEYKVAAIEHMNQISQAGRHD
ncbi:hypothetical protein ACHAWX_006570 [Stephanocyclus meneghinianus]